MAEKPTYAELVDKIRQLEEKESNNKKVLDALKQSEEHYRLLVETSNDIIWFFDLKSMTFSFSSSSAERILGYPQGTDTGVTLEDIFPLP